MFNSIGWGELAVLAVAALFIFGPERLPGLAKDSAAGLKRIRHTMTGVRSHLDESLGEDFEQLRRLDLRQYDPRALLREHLLGDADESPRAVCVPPDLQK